MRVAIASDGPRLWSDTMPFNFIEAIEAQVIPGMQSTTRKETSTGIVAVVAGIVHRGSSTEGAASLLSTLQSPGARPSSLLGDRADEVTKSVATSTGVDRPAAIGIISKLLPVAGSVLGREVASRRLDANGLSELLQSQKRHLVEHPDLPAGLAGMFGGTRTASTVSSSQAKDVGVFPAMPHKRSRSWLPLLLGGLALLGLLLLLFRGRKPTMPEVSTREQATVEAPVVRAPRMPAIPAIPPPPAVPEPEPVGQTEVTGAEITRPSTGSTGSAGSAGDELSAHMTGTGTLPDRVGLPGVTFKFGTTELNEGGDQTIDRLAELMKAHPSTRIRLEGHTDAVGSADVNAPLSYRRATAVKKMLTDRGIDEQRIETTGRSEAAPAAPNVTKDGRAQNRRIDVLILER